jgi:hypothetical protein
MTMRPGGPAELANRAFSGPREQSIIGRRRDERHRQHSDHPRRNSMTVPRMRPARALLALAVAALVAGCGDEDPMGPAGDPPALPDAASFAVDLSAFAMPEKWEVSPQSPSDSSNFLTARATAAVIGIGVVAIAAPAAAAFEGAFGAQPVRQADGSWTWSYSVVYGQASFDLSLNGRAAAGGSEWAMRVTTNGLGSNLTDYLWYSGAVSASGDEGMWQLYDPSAPAEPVDALRIDWQTKSADDHSAIWTNNRPGSDGEGDVLAFARSEDDASIEFSDASNGTTSSIAWNVDTTAGSLTMPFYNQGEKSCWDSNHLNAACPEWQPAGPRQQGLVPSDEEDAE